MTTHFGEFMLEATWFIMNNPSCSARQIHEHLYRVAIPPAHLPCYSFKKFSSVMSSSVTGKYYTHWDSNNKRPAIWTRTSQGNDVNRFNVTQFGIENTLYQDKPCDDGKIVKAKSLYYKARESNNSTS